MKTADFVDSYPRLFHIASSPSCWPSIERDGLRSVAAILDLLYFDSAERHAIEAEQRITTMRLPDPDTGPFEIRDQKPLNVSKLASCLTDMTVTEWLRLLNEKVFFWPTEQRVERLLRAYPDRDHLVLVIRTSSLVAIHGPEIAISPINTGAVLFDPQPRGSDTFLPIADYPYELWRRKRGSRAAVAEVTVNYAVPDILNHLVRLEIRHHGRPPTITSPEALTLA